MARLKDYYKAEVAGRLNDKFNYKSPMQIPKFDKIVINIGCGDAKDNTKVIDNVIAEITMITGQKAVRTSRRIRSLNFKLKKA